MVTIFITEKPSVAQEYKSVLKVKSAEKTDGYIEGFSPVLHKDVVITWAVGHLIAIAPPEVQNKNWDKWTIENLPMIPETFKYEPQAATIKQYRIVKSLYTRKDIEAIYYAGDSGREGIYIQALIRNQIFNGNTPRFEERVVWIDSYTEESILEGIRTAKSYASYQPMIDSGYARAKTDFLIGINFTEAFTLTCGGFKKVINTGRVMDPTLAMVVKRQEEIDNFVKTPFYGIKADDSIFWKAIKGTTFFESDDLYNENGFLKREMAESLISRMNQNKMLTVSDVKVSQKTEYAPYLFNLADLQAYCSKVYKISPAQALSIAQSLYEKKFTTYPRTDCRFLSSAVATDLKKKGMNVPARYVDDSKVTDHYAIIPTFHGDASSLSGLEEKVYLAILKRFKDTMKPPYIYDAVSITYVHPQTKEYFFESFRKVKQQGFREAVDEEVSNKNIPSKNEVISVKEFTLREMETKPPVAYTTGSLILAMEKAGKLIDDEELREQIKTCGIGTSATRASIIEKLQEKGFISVDNKQKIEPTEFGKVVIRIVEKYDETLISPIKTADMESKLNAIAEKKLSIDAYMREVEEYIRNTVSCIINTPTEKIATSTVMSLGKCPNCGGAISSGKFGPYCVNKCGMDVKRVFGKTLTDAQVKNLLMGKKTLIKGLTSKEGKTYDVYAVPKGITDYSYVGKDGKTYSGKCFQCDREFPQRKFSK